MKSFKTNKKLIYIFLVLSIILSGMYFGTDNEEFRCNKSGGTSASYVYQVIDDTYGGNEICMGEMLGLKYINVFQTKDIISYRYNLKINFSFALILLEFIIMIFFSMNYYYIHEKLLYLQLQVQYLHISLKKAIIKMQILIKMQKSNKI